MLGFVRKPQWNNAFYLQKMKKIPQVLLTLCRDLRCQHRQNETVVLLTNTAIQSKTELYWDSFSVHNLEAEYCLGPLTKLFQAWKVA